MMSDDSQRFFKKTALEVFNRPEYSWRLQLNKTAMFIDCIDYIVHRDGQIFSKLELHF